MEDSEPTYHINKLIKNELWKRKIQLKKPKGMLKMRETSSRKLNMMPNSTCTQTALDAVLQVRKGKGRPSIDKYKEAAGQRDRKLLAAIVTGYDIMHLSMGYDGVKNKNVCEEGLRKQI